MRFIVLFAVCLFVSCIKEQGVKIYIKSDLDDVKNYEIYQSIGGAFLDGYKTTGWLNNKNEDVIELSIDNRSVRIVYEGLLAQLYLSPGDEVYLEFKTKDKVILFQGDNAEGHYFYNQLRIGDYYGFSNIGIEAFKVSKSYDKALKKIEALEKVELDQLDYLLQEGKVTRSYYELCRSSIHIYYSLAGSYVFCKDRDNWYDKNWDAVKSIDTVDRIRLYYTGLLEKFDNLEVVKNHSEYYRFWLGERITMLKMLEMSSISYVCSAGYFNVFKLVSERLRESEDREHALALMLMDDYCIFQNRDRIVMRNYQDFVKEFPDSKYTKVLETFHKQYISYYDKVDKSTKGGLSFVKDYDSVKSFSSLEDLSRGKVIYIDIWATWCGPCRDEFEKSVEFWKYAKNNNIELMFLSLDNSSLHDKWIEMIKFYNLQGVNIRASEALASDIHKRFGLGDNKGLAIPRYLILNDGKVVDENASRPSSKEKLFQQLNEYL